MSHKELSSDIKIRLLYWYKFDFFLMFQGSIAQHGLMPEEWINIRILYFKKGPEFTFSNIENLIVLSGLIL